MTRPPSSSERSTVGGRAREHGPAVRGMTRARRATTDVVAANVSTGAAAAAATVPSVVAEAVTTAAPSPPAMRPQAMHDRSRQRVFLAVVCGRQACGLNTGGMARCRRGEGWSGPWAHAVVLTTARQILPIATSFVTIPLLIVTSVRHIGLPVAEPSVNHGRHIGTPASAASV